MRWQTSKSRNWLIALFIVLAGTGGWWLTRDEQQAAEDQPLLARVETGSIENTIASSGTIKPSHYVDVGAQVSGMLQKLLVDVGDVVTQGQLLAEIDARVQEAKVQASRASIAAQEAQLIARRAALELGKANAERQQRLRAADATSALEYDTAMNNLAAAQSSLEQLQKQIDQSKATLTSDETQLEFASIFAPVAGTVVSIELNEGRTLNAAQQAPTILRIADLSTMTVEAEISEADIGTVKTGMAVYFTTLDSGERRWYGTLRQVLPTPTVTNNVVLYTGLFDVDNSDGALFSEMTAQVYFITSAAENVLTVPVGALSYPTDVPVLAAAAPAGAPAGGQANGAAPGEAADRQGAGGPPPGFVPGQGRQGPPGGGGGQGRRGRGGRPGPAGDANAPRPALVTVVKDDGSREERSIMVGVTSRVAAEVVSGLREGEQVIAGILQADTPAEAPPAGNNFRNGGFQGGGFPGGGGGFRGF